MSADAALVYLRRYAVLVGKRIVVATNNDSAYAVAEALAEAGAEVEILDSRAAGPASQLSVTRGAAIEGVVGTRGVEAVRANGRTRDCDALLLSGGWSPTVHLYAQARGKLRYDEALAALAPVGGVADLAVAGAANGAFTLDAALREGHRAGGGEGAAPNAPAGQYRIEASWPKADDEGRRWIDFQNDVTLKDVALAAREGYVSVEHLKRYTTLGMATDQGKTANVNGLAAMAALTGRTIDETGTTTYRPPFVPVPMGVIAGRRRGAFINPLRRLPLEAEHRAEGAQMREYGGWLRPAWYGPDDPELSIQREAARARDAVALFDGSSLGKIEVIGPDAAKLADFHSYNRLSTLKPGKIRYGFLLQESGIVFDDGVTLRLGEDRFLVSCSSGHTDAVRMRLELWRQDRFDAAPRRHSRHDRPMGDAHRHRPALARSRRGVRNRGRARRPEPAAHGLCDRRIRRRAAPGRAGELHRRPLLRAFRAGAARSRASRARLAEKLQAFGGGLMGLEALMILRAEKGFIVVGKDTDGTTMPHDLGVAGPRELEGGRIYRQALAVHARRQRQGPQAIRRPERRGGRGAAADRRACRDGLRRGAALAGLCDVELRKPEPWPAGRARPRRRGAQSAGRDGRRLSSRRRAPRDHRAHGRARSGRKAAPCVRRDGRRRGDGRVSSSTGRACRRGRSTGSARR